MIYYPVATAKKIQVKLNGVEGCLVNAPGVLPIMTKVAAPGGSAWVLRAEPSVNGMPVLPVIVPHEFSLN